MPVFPLEGNLCSDCINRFYRSMIPIDYEVYGINLDELEIDDDEELVLEQHTCLITNEDIDGVTKSCNHYKPRKETDFLISNKFQPVR